jgi:hypothetical protein
MYMEPVALSPDRADIALGLKAPISRQRRARLVKLGEYPELVYIGGRACVLVEDIREFTATLRDRAAAKRTKYARASAAGVAARQAKRLARESITAPTTAGQAEIARQPGTGAAP